MTIVNQHGPKFPVGDDLALRDYRWKFFSPPSLSRLLMLTFNFNLFMLISNNWIFPLSFFFFLVICNFICPNDEKLEGHMHFCHALGIILLLR